MPTPLAIPPWLNARRTWGGSSKRQAMARATKPAAKLSSERMASLPGLSDGSPISSRQVILLGLLLLPRTILVETIDHRQHQSADDADHIKTCCVSIARPCLVQFPGMGDAGDAQPDDAGALVASSVLQGCDDNANRPEVRVAV